MRKDKIRKGGRMGGGGMGGRGGARGGGKEGAGGGRSLASQNFLFHLYPTMNTAWRREYRTTDYVAYSLHLP